MSYNVKTLSVFEKQAKKLFKKYNSLKSDLLKLILELKENPD
jgi:mRNA-degrading endonuclease RelE of RelBE toxin-antitoxin system